MMKNLFILILTLFFVLNAKALDRKRYQIVKIKTREIVTAPISLQKFYQGSAVVGSSLCQNNNQVLSAVDGVPTSDLDVADQSLDKIINMGKKVWMVVEAGKPVVNLESDVATALPLASGGCWLDLEGWKAPVSKTYEVSLENLYGMEVVRFVYRIVFLPGGSFNGLGHYIGYAAMEPVDLNVMWLFKFKAKASVPTVFNMGRKSNPLSAMYMTVDWVVDTPFQHRQGSKAFTLTGYGTIIERR